MHVRPLFAALLAIATVAGCDSGGGAHRDAGTNASSPAARSTSTVPSDTRDEIVLRGNATLDGAAFDADFLGAVVRRDRLVTACQAQIPPIFHGRFEIGVLTERAALGCGARGSDVLLWTFVQGKKMYTTLPFAWPPDSADLNIKHIEFSTSEPNGAALPVTELAGEVSDARGNRLPAGTRVEAYVGTTLCGMASVRVAGGTFIGYILNVVGPDSVAGCDRDAPINFRINGQPAKETYRNTLQPPAAGSGATFQLTQS